MDIFDFQDGDRLPWMLQFPNFNHQQGSVGEYASSCQICADGTIRCLDGRLTDS